MRRLPAATSDARQVTWRCSDDCDASCSEFYSIVRNKPSKYETEDFIPMEAIHSTHKASMKRPPTVIIHADLTELFNLHLKDP